MNRQRTDSPWHGPLCLPDGVHPMVDRVDTGSVLVEIQYDPAVTEADLAEAEDWILAFIESRRRRRPRAEGGITTAHPPALPNAAQEIGA